MIKIKNKKIETIRINEELTEFLQDVPKGQSYANWVLDKIKRLNAHEENAVCWILSTSNVGPNRMSIGDRNGQSPIFDEVIEIVSDIPRTNMSQEEREDGWLGQTNEYSSYAHGGFASIGAARTYIIDYMEGKLIPDELLEDDIEYGVRRERFTTAKYEFDKYFFIEDWFQNDEPEVNGMNDEEIEILAEKISNEAKAEGIGILGNIVEYIKDLRDSN